MFSISPPPQLIERSLWWYDNGNYSVWYFLSSRGMPRGRYFERCPEFLRTWVLLHLLLTLPHITHYIVTLRCRTNRMIFLKFFLQGEGWGSAVLLTNCTYSIRNGRYLGLCTVKIVWPGVKGSYLPHPSIQLKNSSQYNAQECKGSDRDTPVAKTEIFFSRGCATCSNQRTAVDCSRTNMQQRWRKWQ